MHYEIRIDGHLGTRWAAWFDGLSITTEDDGTTVLRGSVVDQAALHGLLQKLRDVGIPLISLTPVEAPATQAHAPHQERVSLQQLPLNATRPLALDINEGKLT